MTEGPPQPRISHASGKITALSVTPTEGNGVPRVSSTIETRGGGIRQTLYTFSYEADPIAAKILASKNERGEVGVGRFVRVTSYLPEREPGSPPVRRVATGVEVRPESRYLGANLLTRGTLRRYRGGR